MELNTQGAEIKNNSQDQVQNNSANKAADLINRARLITEHKSPSGNNHAQNNQGAAAQNNNQRPELKKSAFWDQEPVQAPAPVQQQQQNPEVKPNEVKFTREKALASADINSEAINNLQRLIFTLLENMRFRNKFKDHEIKKLHQYDLTGFTKRSELPANLPQDQLSLWTKWNHLYKRHEIKLGKIPMQEKEINNYRQMLFSLQEYNQKVFSPAWGVVFQIGNTIIQRSIDIYMED